MNFKELGLKSALVQTCESLGYTEPTPIQKETIPVILEGSDVIAGAETGTGKTAAFLLPLIQRLMENKPKGIAVLVLAPTRELALQIEINCRQFAPKKLRCVALIGGAGYKKQIEGLRGVNIIVATPGRLMDFMQQGAIDFSNLQTLVLDEADRMLDMGFLPAIKRILKALPEKRQTLFFSATITREVETIAHSMMNTKPESIEISRRGKTAGTIEQTVYPVAANSKTVLLLDLLEREKFERVLVFTRTKRGADKLAHILEKRDHKSNRIHGDRSQSQREAALRGFKTGKTRVLIATDVAARGIDIDSVSHVINYDIPEAPEDYIHRIGRTGRAGNTGRAITLVTPGEEFTMREIEKLTGQKVERVLLPNFGGVLPAAEISAKRFASGRKSSRSFRSRRAR
ncbi:MAG TPA: DEAD/DEAH box helicase [Pyrinomonadaceae bacterium]|nr:DEAD/DEAH box helicase [Pyrinomonadaceae bacterium]